MSKEPTLSWECASCGKGTKSTRIKLYPEETRCPSCGFEKVSTWETPPRGRQRTNTSGKTIRFKPQTWDLILQRQRVSPKGTSLSSIVEQCVNQVLGAGADQSELRRMHQWQCLLAQDKRALTEVEEHILEQVFTLYSNNLPIEAEVWDEPTVGQVFSILTTAQEFHSLRLPIADDYSQIFCGLVCLQDGFPSLWAYTLYLLFLRDRTTVTLDKLLSCFSEGLPTYQASQHADKFQRVYLSSEQSQIDYTRTPQYWPDKIR